MHSPATRCFKARQAEFEAIRRYIDSACAVINPDDRQRVVLLVEELFTNSVNHGYGGDCDEPVWITVRVDGEDCHLIYEDRARPHDPFSIPDKGASRSPLEERPVGGLGILLLAAFSASHRYERRGDRNVIELQLRRSA